MCNFYKLLSHIIISTVTCFDVLLVLPFFLNFFFFIVFVIYIIFIWFYSHFTNWIIHLLPIHSYQMCSDSLSLFILYTLNNHFNLVLRFYKYHFVSHFLSVVNCFKGFIRDATKHLHRLDQFVEIFINIYTIIASIQFL